MQELETLLNSLLRMGYRPKGRDVKNIRYEEEYSIREGKIIFCFTCVDSDWFYADLRRLVSIESGLRQFCVENELTRGYNGDEWKYTETFPGDYRDYPADEYQYRLLESALIPEEELGQFLVDNIKIDG